jgi:hypothetical protein
MKNLIAAIFLFPTFVMAQSDSIAVFHRPEKVIIQINEGHSKSSRLSDMMDFFNVDTHFEVISPDKSIKISCARNIEASSCIFRFLPGTSTSITLKKLQASTTLSDLKLEGNGVFDFYFESSMSDKFSLQIDDGKIIFSASKKIIN